MLDQYENPVPADLVVIPEYSFLASKERDAVDEADWWEANGVLLYEDKRGIGGDDPRDAGLPVDEDGNIGVQVFKIDLILHRGNLEDGWYHA